MKEVDKKFQDLPCPVILVGEEGEVLWRNRLAQKLLPPPCRLKRFLYQFQEKQGEIVFEAELDKIRYFVAVFPENNGAFRLCFFEDFLPFYEPFSRVVLEEMQDFFWHLFEEKEQREKEVSAPGFLDSLAARTYRLRQEEKAYLRLLKMRSYVPQERVSCSVSGFFHHLQSALATRGLRLLLDCPENASAEFSTGAFSLLALNLIQFVYLFEGGDEVSVCVREAEEKIFFEFSFADPSGLSKVFGETFMEGGDKKIPDALVCSPLFCALCLCRRENVAWQILAENGQIRFAFSLPRALALPAAFLAESTSEEIGELMNLEKEWFSR